MNFLYPNFLRKIDHYLKINYPHVWRTRVHDFGWFSLILGNIVAVVLGGLVVGQNNILNEENVITLHSGLAVLLVFVGLFWAMRLLRFKIKFSNFKMMLITWGIYVLCVASLGLNLATFTTSIAHRTANLYSNKIVQADYAYIDVHRLTTTSRYKGDYDIFPYDERRTLKKEYQTDEFMNIMYRYGHQDRENGRIYHDDVYEVENKIGILNEAKTFIKQPTLGRDFYNHKKKTTYHELLRMHWEMGILMLYFLPAILFLVSMFGMRNVLICGFCTALIAGLVFLITETFFGGHVLLRREFLVIQYVFITSVLMITLIISKNRLKSWNYFAGVFMLIIGILSFSVFAFIVETYWLGNKGSFLFVGIKILPFSLMASLLSAWMIAKGNDQPILH